MSDKTFAIRFMGFCIVILFFIISIFMKIYYSEIKTAKNNKKIFLEAKNKFVEETNVKVASCRLEYDYTFCSGILNDRAVNFLCYNDGICNWSR